MRAIFALFLLLSACTIPERQDAARVILAERVVAIVDVEEAFAPQISRAIEEEMVKLIGPAAEAQDAFAARDLFALIGTLDSNVRDDGVTVLTLVWTVEQLRGGLPFSFTVAVVPEVRDGSRVSRAEIRGLAWLSAFDFMSQPQVQQAINR